MNETKHAGRRLAAPIPAAVLAALSAGCCPTELADDTPIYRPGSWGYLVQLWDFEISPERGHEIAAEAARHRGHQAPAERPLLIVGREYLYGAPSRRGVWLSGFYVDGHTGEVAYRKPDRMVYCGPVAGVVESGEPLTGY